MHGRVSQHQARVERFPAWRGADGPGGARPPAAALRPVAAPARGRIVPATGLVPRVVAHLERNYMAPITLRDLEAATGHSAYQIIRAFRRDVGTTPHVFLMRLRVRRAASLLAGGESIVGAAVEAGFADQSHLTRHFKRVFGTTPGRFLREARRAPGR